MIQTKEHYRQFQKQFLVFMTKNAEAVSPAETDESQITPEISEKNILVITPEMSKEEIYHQFYEHYGPEKKHRQNMNNYVQSLMSDTFSDYKKVLIDRSVERYKKDFKIALKQLSDTQERTARHCKKAIRKVKNSAKQERKYLAQKINLAKEAKNEEPEISDSFHLPKKMRPLTDNELDAIERRSDHGPTEPEYAKGVTYTKEYLKYNKASENTQDEFKEYTQALCEKYMTNHAFESDLGQIFIQGITAEIEAKIDFQFKESKASAENLKAIKSNLEKRFKGYANLDKRGGMIDLYDLEILLEMQAGEARKTDLMKMVNEAGSDKDINIQKMEALIMEDPEAWNKSVTVTAETMIEDVIRNGNEQALIDKVQKYPAGKTIDNFEDAQTFFLNLMSLRAMGGVKEAMQTLKDFNKVLNGERINFLDEVPKSLQQMVVWEREMLLNGRTIPEDDYGKAIVEFMSTDRKTREERLSSDGTRETLFMAIKIAQNDYVKHFKKTYRSLPRKTEQLTSISGDDPSKTTSHDRAARIQAIITLANEAEWIINNFSKTEKYKNEEITLTDELKNTEIVRRGSKDYYIPDVNFRDVKKLYKTGYVSVASRGGFNGRDLALNGVKVLASLTVVFNAMNAIRNKSGLFNNPFMYAGLAAAYGIDKYQKNPEVSRIFKANEAEREGIITRVHLNSLNNKAPSLKSFVNTSSEWEAMKHLKSRQIKKILKKARKRYAPSPTITKEDLKDIMPTGVWLNLPDKGNERDRFLFYEKFLTANQNILMLKKNCEYWK